LEIGGGKTATILPKKKLVDCARKDATLESNMQAFKKINRPSFYPLTINHRVKIGQPGLMGRPA
jgi:hypothetical protein